MIKHRGIQIVEVTVKRYEVRRPDGKVFKTFATSKAARNWIDGYMKAVEQFTKENSK